jgi:hypothetical protein
MSSTARSKATKRLRGYGEVRDTARRVRAFGDAIEVVQVVTTMEMRDQVLSWVRRRRERAGWIEVEADHLIGAFGPDAYAAARTMQRRAHDGKERRHWRDMARAINRMTAKRACLDMVTRVFGRRAE